VASGPVVVAVLSHRDAPLLQRLVDRVLEGDRTVALVHHDPRGEPHGLRPNDRVVLVPDPQPCDWGRMNFAQAMVRCLDEALHHVPDVEWILLTSGQDYPVRHMRAIEADLSSSDADAMLRFFKVAAHPDPGEHPWQTRCRRRYLHRLRLPGSRRSIPFPRKSPFTDGLDLFVSDTWVNLRRPAAERIVSNRASLRHVESYLSRCANPDEALLATLLLNGAGDLRVVNNRRRFIKWTEGQPHPALLDAADVPAILDSDAYFARKVDSRLTSDVLELLDRAATATRGT